MSFEAPQPNLARMLRQALLDEGFGWEAARTPVHKTYVWQRPPLVSREMLHGLPLQPYLCVATPLDTDDLVDVYERFVAGAVRRRVLHEGMDEWLCQELHMRREDALMLFPPIVHGQLRLGAHLRLVQFAALVAYNVPSRIEEDEDTFAVIAQEGGYEFGVRGGELISNMEDGKPPVPVRGLLAETGNLSDIARGLPVMADFPNLFDTIRAWLDGRRKSLGLEHEPFITALSTLWWKTGGELPNALWEITLRETSKDALRRAIEEARGYRGYAEPMQAMFDIFVPQFMTPQAFSRRFGSPLRPPRLPLSEKVQERWDREIHELEPLSSAEEHEKETA